VSVIVGLHQIKYLDNLAQVRRVVSAYGGGEIYTTGSRIRTRYELEQSEGRLPRELRMRDYANARVIIGQQIETFNNMDQRVVEMGTNKVIGRTIPVAIEIVDNAMPLEHFEHPEHAMYVFGPEDGNVPPQILRQCHHVVQIPTTHCINVSHAVATVLYDRKVKSA